MNEKLAPQGKYMSIKDEISLKESSNNFCNWIFKQMKFLLANAMPKVRQKYLFHAQYRVNFIWCFEFFIEVTLFFLHNILHRNHRQNLNNIFHSISPLENLYKIFIIAKLSGISDTFMVIFYTRKYFMHIKKIFTTLYDSFIHK